MRRCLSCGLVFAHPLRLTATAQKLYAGAHDSRGNGGVARLRRALAWRSDLLDGEARVDAALGQAHVRALAYIRDSVAPGSLVLDVGCGSGLFLEAARRQGYAVAGIDIAEAAVNVLKGEGYQVFCGTIDEVPEGWAQPAVCTSFYVLHHVSDPVAFLETIRRRFPAAQLVVAEQDIGGDFKKPGPPDLPPRRLTAWQAASLRRALERAGFAVELLDSVRQQPRHPGLDGSLSGVYGAGRRLIPAGARPYAAAGTLSVRRRVSGLVRTTLGGHWWSGRDHILAVARPDANGDQPS